MVINSIIRRDNDPFSRWDSGEIQKELINLDSATTSLDSGLLASSGNQTVRGQKTFSYLFYDTGYPTYDSVMSRLQNDIAPVFGTGAKGINSNVLEELTFSGNNVSGVLATVGGENGVFLNSPVVLEYTTGSNNISIKTAANIPLAAYDSAKNGDKPSTSSTDVSPYFWPTSKAVSTSSTGTYIAGASYPQTAIIAGWNEVDRAAQIFTLNVDSENTISTSFKSFKILGIVPGNPILGQVKSSLVNTEFYLENVFNTLNSNWVGTDCVLQLRLTFFGERNPVVSVNGTAVWTACTGLYRTETVLVPIIYSPGITVTVTDCVSVYLCNIKGVNKF